MELALALHVVRKDLRHLWILLALWGFLLLAQAGLIGCGFSTGPGDFVWQTIYTVLAVGIPLLQAVVLVILVPLLIQGEPLVGTTAFWFTRPLSRRTLLSAKAGFVIAILVLPPLVVQTVVLAANLITVHDILRAIPEILYGSLSIILPLAALAVITRTFARFSLWLVAVWVIMAIAGTIMQFVRMACEPEAFLASSQDPTALLSASLVSGLVSMMGCGFVVGYQYLTRRTRVSIVALVVTVVLSILIQTLWNYDFLKPQEPPASLTEFPPDSAIVSLGKNSLSSRDAVTLSLGRSPRTETRGSLSFAQVPPGYQLSVTSVNSTVTVPDHKPFISGRYYSGFDMDRELWPDAISEVLGGIPVLNSSSPSNVINTQILNLDTADYQYLRNRSGTFEATLKISAARVEIIGRVPLRVGERIDENSHHYQISQVLHQTSGVRVILKERQLNLWTTQKPAQLSMLNREADRYLLVNPSRRQAILPDRDFNLNMASILMQSSTLLINQSVPLQFTGTRNDQQVVTVDEEWLAGAELVILRARPVGFLTRALTVKDFSLNSKP